MTRAVTSLAVGALVLSLGVAARADIACFTSLGDQGLPAVGAQSMSPAAEAPASNVPIPWIFHLAATAPADPQPVPDGVGSDDQRYAEPFPALPSSASLFLAAMGSAAAWQCGRSVKKLHLGAIPHWYHSEGPHQVGHAIAVLPDLSFTAVVYDVICDPSDEVNRRFSLREQALAPPDAAHRRTQQSRGPPGLPC